MSRAITTATVLLTLAVSGCTTVSVAASPINSRWVGHPAGEFFARYSPPLSDTENGSTTIYNWRGGYKKIKLQNGKTVNASCSAKITVSDSYVIRDIAITADRPGANGPSYCTELLTEN